MEGMDWKLNAKHRAEALARLIALDAPDCLIGSQWYMLWCSLQNAYGDKVFEGGQENLSDIRFVIDQDN